MGYLAAMFLVFSLGFSWVSGDKQKDELNLALEETQYEHKTMGEQVRQAKIKASLDASKMDDLTKKITKLSKDKSRVESKLERTKLRRARLLRPQIAKIKDKIEAPYKVKLTRMEKAVKTAKADLAKLRAENDKLKRQYRELIRKNKERLSEGDTFEKTPFTQEGAPGVTPVSQESAPGVTPVSQDTAPGTTPVSQDMAPGTTPVSQDMAPGTTPVSQDMAPGTTPISQDTAPGTTPVSQDTVPGTTPLTQDTAPGKIPVSQDNPPLIVPSEELVKLDNDELVRLENINQIPEAPVAKDLLSSEEVLKTAVEAAGTMPDILRVEQIKLKEGWL